MTVTVHHGDSRAILPTLPAESVHAVVTDPPYALTAKKKGGVGTASVSLDSPYGRARIGTGNGAGGFMGQKWDTGETAFDPAFWREVMRVMKPGAHLVAFGGTRTYHRLACAIEDAGFEIRDQIGWLFGSGFPKSHDVSKAIDRAAGAEREVCGTRQEFAAKANKQRVGVSWADASVADGSFSHPDRIGQITAPATDAAKQWEGWGTALKPAWEPIVLARKPLSEKTVAANVLKHGTGALNVDACRVETDGNTARPPLSTQKHEGWKRPWNDDPIMRAAAEGRRNVQHDKRDSLGRWPANVVHDGSDEVVAAFPDSGGQNGSVSGGEPSSLIKHAYGARGRVPFGAREDGTGSAARFFYSSKADAADRLGSKHPTVKPVDLMAWLVKLITPPGGTALDPFAGSGSTGMACLREGFDCILIEREAQYIADIQRRLKHVRGEDAPLFSGDAA